MARRLVGGSDLSHGDKILVAMLRAGFGRLDPIAYEDIVVEAWRLFPETFAMRGYPEYPDGSDIHKRLYDTMPKAGLTVLHKPKRFALTDEGRRVAQQVLDRLLDRASAVAESQPMGDAADEG